MTTGIEKTKTDTQYDQTQSSTCQMFHDSKTNPFADLSSVNVYEHHSWKSMLRLLTFAKLQIDHIELQISIQI